jgi:hypothetical protein
LPIELRIGDWGLGIGLWIGDGMGVCRLMIELPNPQSPIANPIPNPQSPIKSSIANPIGNPQSPIDNSIGILQSAICNG